MSWDSSLQYRVDRGRSLGSSDDNAVVPFHDGWEDSDLLQSVNGSFGTTLTSYVNGGFKPTIYKYRWIDGSIIQIVIRLDHATKKKAIRPAVAERVIGGRTILRPGAIKAPRPLFRLDELAARRTATVLIVEGEKATDAGRERFPGHVVTTWSGGAGGLSTADLTPLYGRDVIYWPDNDAPGAASVTALAEKLSSKLVASFGVVTVPSYFPPKWDVADPLPVHSND